MCKHLRIITFILFIILILLEIISLTINILILTNCFFLDFQHETIRKIKTFNIITSFSGMILNILGIINIIVFGNHSLYFKEKFKLSLYLIL